MKERFFKTLNGTQSCNGGDARWIMNQWMPVANPKPCVSGYHLCRDKDLVMWLNKDIYLAEGRGKRIDCYDKVVFEQARIIKHMTNWNEKSARLFSCWCVRQVWHLLTDARSRKAVEVAEKYAEGKATQADLSAARDAAMAAARDAAMAAARDAAWAAARDAQTKELMRLLFEE